MRPYLIPPVQATSTLSLASIANMPGSGSLQRVPVLGTGAAAPPGAWVISSSQLTTPDGRALLQRASRALRRQRPAGPCADPPVADRGQACNDYIESLHLRQTVTYQPASRYWAFQWTETAIYLALALALAGFCFWRISPDRSAAPNIRRPRTRQPAPALQSSP